MHRKDLCTCGKKKDARYTCCIVCRRLHPWNKGVKTRYTIHGEEEGKVRRLAADRGERYYFFARPCKCGHMSKRYVKNGNCYQCQTGRNQAKPVEQLLYEEASKRCRRLGLLFNISPGYILSIWPKGGRCPVLGIILERGRGKYQDSSPTLDRVDPAKGYVRGNVVVMSFLANLLKGDEIDPAVFERVADWMNNPTTYSHCHGFTPQGYYDSYSSARLSDAKKRAIRQGVPFSLSPRHVKEAWPMDNLCPVFRTPLIKGKGRLCPSSPTIERIVPQIGYVPENIAIISFRANRIKSKATDQGMLLKIASWLRQGTINAS